MNNNDLRIEADTCTAIRTHQCTFDQRCPPRKGGSQHSLPDKRNTKQNHIKLINPTQVTESTGWGWMGMDRGALWKFWVLLGNFGVNIADWSTVLLVEDVEVHSDSDSVADTGILGQPECFPLGISACRTLPQLGRSLGFQDYYNTDVHDCLHLWAFGIMIAQICDTIKVSWLLRYIESLPWGSPGLVQFSSPTRFSTYARCAPDNQGHSIYNLAVPVNILSIKQLATMQKKRLGRSSRFCGRSEDADRCLVLKHFFLVL